MNYYTVKLRSAASAHGAMAQSRLPERLSVAAINMVAIAVVLLLSVGCGGGGGKSPEQVMDFVLEDAVALRICSLKALPSAETEPRLLNWLADCDSPSQFDQELPSFL